MSGTNAALFYAMAVGYDMSQLL
eukprot:COSAG03_NODE_24360_length_273_cov_0.442529_1_plen_22_part_01